MDWVRGEKLGHGSFATVNLAKAGSQSCVFPPLMAVKSCGFSHSSSLMNEKLILDDLKDCPEIIRCFGESCSYEKGEKLYNVLLEYAPGGALADKLRNSGGGMPESDVRGYTKALLKGIHYIHKFGYVHCDIKLQNILLGANGRVKIADFGLAKRAGGRKGCATGCELRGTPLYMSPEMVAGGEQGPPADIWALGCVVAEMLSGNPAWRCSDISRLLMRIGVGEEVPEIPRSLSGEGRDFLAKCFVKDPSKRWTAEMLLNHPFICDQDFEDDGSKNREENTPSTSPRCAFDFPDWASSVTCSITSLSPRGYSPESGSWFSGESSSGSGSWSNPAAARLMELVSDQNPNWSVSDDWVTIR
ncbi:Mitogen-activated protein kinase kinase kinase [Sesamum angolense]|uniref:Mitogen-activated protein kinase kinase kinase n=1 Tax=Sesamum angolense TaxID=2727404 RepID=A0AAE1XD82_9LAMI|nr:Mitogen-activated protein kinase kinase kinase [Sesamum angolense]